METSLTTWEAKERAGLLALETEEWREKRRIAEDPNTTADVLDDFTDEIHQIVEKWKLRNMDVRSDYRLEAADCQALLLARAVTANPNAPLETLLFLLDLPSSFDVSHAFSCNPIASLIVLEMPDFWGHLRGTNAHERLLREETLPRSVIGAIRQCLLNDETQEEWFYNQQLIQSCALHTSVAGEIQNLSEGQKALTLFWKNYCKSCAADKEQCGVHHREFAELGLAPEWACVNAGGMSAATQEPLWFADAHQAANDILAAISDEPFHYTDFERFVGNLHFGFSYQLDDWLRKGRLLDWLPRLDVALTITPYEEPIWQDQWNRSPLDLLNHFAHDGNRLVRWAAQTRLADPDFVFTWHEENG